MSLAATFSALRADLNHRRAAGYQPGRRLVAQPGLVPEFFLESLQMLARPMMIFKISTSTGFSPVVVRPERPLETWPESCCRS